MCPIRQSSHSKQTFNANICFNDMIVINRLLAINLRNMVIMIFISNSALLHKVHVGWYIPLKLLKTVVKMILKREIETFWR